jgi:hypothetical protein
MFMRYLVYGPVTHQAGHLIRVSKKKAPVFFVHKEALLTIPTLFYIILYITRHNMVKGQIEFGYILYF